MTLLKTLLTALFVFQSITARATSPKVCAEALIAHITATQDHRLTWSEFEMAIIGRSDVTALVTIPIANLKGSLFNAANFEIGPGLKTRPEFSVYHEGYFSYVVQGNVKAWENVIGELDKLEAHSQILNSTLSEKPETFEYPRDHFEITSGMNEKEVEDRIRSAKNTFVLLHNPTEQTYIVYPEGKGVRLSSEALEELKVGSSSSADASIYNFLHAALAYSKENSLEAADYVWREMDFLTHTAFMRIRNHVRQHLENLKASTVAVLPQLTELLGPPPAPAAAEAPATIPPALEETAAPEPLVVHTEPESTSVAPPPVVPEPTPVAFTPPLVAPALATPVDVVVQKPAPVSDFEAPEIVAEKSTEPKVEPDTAEIRPSAPTPTPKVIHRAPVLKASHFERESDYELFVAILRQSALDRPNELRPRNFLRDGILGFIEVFGKPDEVLDYRNRVLEDIQFGDFDSRARLPFNSPTVRARTMDAANLLGKLVDVEFSTPAIQPSEAEEFFARLTRTSTEVGAAPTEPKPVVVKEDTTLIVPAAPVTPPAAVGLHFAQETDYRMFVDILRRNSRYWPTAPPSHYLRDSTIGFLKMLAPSKGFPEALEYVQKEINFDAMDMRTGAVGTRPETRARVLRAAKLLAKYSDQTWNDDTITSEQAAPFFIRLNQVAPEALDYRFADEGDLDTFLSALSNGTKTPPSKQFLTPALLKMIRVAVKPAVRAKFEAFVNARLRFEYSDAQFIQTDNQRRVNFMHFLFGLADEFKIEWTRPAVTHEEAEAMFLEMLKRLANPPVFDAIPPAPVAIRFEAESDFKQFVLLLNEASAYWQFAPMPHIPFNDAMLGFIARIAPGPDYDRLQKSLIKDIHFRLTDNVQSVTSESTDGRVRIMKAARLLAEILNLNWETPTISHAQFENFYARLKRLVPKPDDYGFANPAQFDLTLQVLSDLAGIPIEKGFAPTALLFVADVITRPEVKAERLGAIRDEFSSASASTENEKIVRALYLLADELDVSWTRPRVSRFQASEFIKKLKERMASPPAPKVEVPSANVGTKASDAVPSAIDQAFFALAAYLKAGDEAQILDDQVLLILMHEAFPSEDENLSGARLAALKTEFPDPHILVSQAWKVFASERLGPEYAQMPLTSATLARVIEQYLVEETTEAAPPVAAAEPPLSLAEAAQRIITFWAGRIKYGDLSESRGLRQAFLDTIQPVVNRLKNPRLKRNIEKMIAEKEFLNFRYKASAPPVEANREQIFMAWTILRLALELPEVPGKATGAMIDETIRVYKERLPILPVPIIER